MSDHPRLLTTAKVAKILECNPETIRGAIRAGRLACYRLGGCTRISHEQLAGYLESSLRPVQETTSLTLNGAEESDELSVRKSDVIADFRRQRAMNKAIDKLR
jgi:excisionase family DNA binding protein